MSDTCPTNKRRYPSEKVASTVVDRMRSKGRDESRYYQCPHCDGWHTTRQAKGRPAKGTLPSLYPRWVQLELREDNRWYFARTVELPNSTRRFRKPLMRYAFFHTSSREVITYETDDENEIHLAVLEGRVLLFNQGGKRGVRHWTVVDKVGLLPGYYALFDAGQSHLLSIVSKPNHGTL